MIILDTNVISALMQREPDRVVVAWLDRQPRLSIWTTSITVFEVRQGLNTLPASKRRESLRRGFEELLHECVADRIAAFDTAAADGAAELVAARRAKGRTGGIPDTMIAGIAIATRATIATRNTSHFDDLPTPVVNPWAG